MQTRQSNRHTHIPHPPTHPHTHNPSRDRGPQFRPAKRPFQPAAHGPSTRSLHAAVASRLRPARSVARGPGPPPHPARTSAVAHARARAPAPRPAASAVAGQEDHARQLQMSASPSSSGEAARWGSPSVSAAPAGTNLRRFERRGTRSNRARPAGRRPAAAATEAGRDALLRAQTAHRQPGQPPPPPLLPPPKRCAHTTVAPAQPAPRRRSPTSRDPRACFHGRVRACEPRRRLAAQAVWCASPEGCRSGMRRVAACPMLPRRFRSLGGMDGWDGMAMACAGGGREGGGGVGGHLLQHPCRHRRREAAHLPPPPPPPRGRSDARGGTRESHGASRRPAAGGAAVRRRARQWGEAWTHAPRTMGWSAADHPTAHDRREPQPLGPPASCGATDAGLT